jgi:dihydroorotase|tara:strand:- start:433 stop:1701 length:1269 start_codon:yes stop_codon:yes gene_type:complete
MKILIKQAKIIDSSSKHNNKICDILINNNKIEKIAKKIQIDSDTKIYKNENLHISQGWFDMHVNFGQPGFEQRETIENGLNAAAKGGFTEVLLMPNTNPSIDNSSMIDFIKGFSKRNVVKIQVAGNLTVSQEGKNIVEIHDMTNNGCIAFTDDKKSIQNNELMKIAMLYIKNSNSLLMNFPNDSKIQKNGVINEGKISTQLGLKGIPNIAEEMMLDRDITLCDYTESKIHESYISTERSVDKIKKAKEKGINITSDVALHNIFLTEEQVNNFDTRFKVLPPLRTKNDNKAIINGLKDGTIDVITSDHNPFEEETKKLEFDNAEFGIIGLESAFGLINKHLEKHLTLNEIIDKISNNPRKILGLKNNSIEEGNYANLTLFNPSNKWEFKENDIVSKSKNSPFVGEELKGKALAIYNNNRFKEL